MILLTWLYRIGLLGLAGLFVWAGLTKLMAPRAFARLISAYDLLPDLLLAPVAIGLPLLEVMAGLGLLAGVRGSLTTIVGLITMFLGVLGYALLNHLDVDCGCFSPDEIHAQQALRVAFIRDLGLLVIALYLMAWRRARKRATVW